MTQAPLRFPPMFKPDGATFGLIPALTLLAAGDALYIDPPTGTPESRELAMRFLDEFFALARAGGFAREDILRSRMARGDASPSLLDDAGTAQQAAGHQALIELFRSFGFPAPSSAA